MRALSNICGSGRYHKTAAERDVLIVRQHELDLFRSPSERAIEVNVSIRTVISNKKYSLFSFITRLNQFHQRYCKIGHSIECVRNFSF